MTHFGDLSSFEFAQKLLPVLPTLEASGVVFAAVGLGDVANARKFAEMLSFPLDKLYAGTCAEKNCVRCNGFVCMVWVGVWCMVLVYGIGVFVVHWFPYGVMCTEIIHIQRQIGT